MISVWLFLRNLLSSRSKLPRMAPSGLASVAVPGEYQYVIRVPWTNDTDVGLPVIRKGPRLKARVPSLEHMSVMWPIITILVPFVWAVWSATRLYESRAVKALAFFNVLFLWHVVVQAVWYFTKQFFFSDKLARSLGWPVGSPFQIQLSFAALGFALAGILTVLMQCPTPARWALSIAWTTFSVGSTYVRLKDVMRHSNIRISTVMPPLCSLASVVALLGSLSMVNHAVC